MVNEAIGRLQALGGSALAMLPNLMIGLVIFCLGLLIATVPRTYDNRRILIPNASLFPDKIEVTTAYEQRRLAFPITIGNGNDIANGRAVIVRALAAVPGVLARPAPEALVTGLGSAGVDMLARFWIDPPRRRDAVDALDGAIDAVKLALTDAGLDLPFPTTQILFHDQTEETEPHDRDRP